MNAEKPLDIGYQNWLTGQDCEFEYFKTTFEFTDVLNTAHSKPSLEIVSVSCYTASDLEAPYIDIVDERYGDTYCIATSLIKGFRQEPFDAKAYNEALESEAKS